MKKFIALVTAFAALAALAIPVSASAYTSSWKMEGTPLAANGTITLTGWAKFSGGTKCHVHAHITLTAGGGTGEASEFSPQNLSECEITETLKTLGCTALTSSTPENLPWMLDDEGTYAKVSSGASGPIKLTNHYTGTGFCPGTVTLEERAGEELRATPDNVSAIHKLTLSGTIHTSLGTTSTVTGELEPVNPADSGTYGL